MPQLACFWLAVGVQPGSWVMSHLSCWPDTIMHEFGHNYGLYHSNSLAKQGDVPAARCVLLTEIVTSNVLLLVQPPSSLLILCRSSCDIATGTLSTWTTPAPWA